MYSGTRNCTTSATIRIEPITRVVLVRLSPSLVLMKSAKVSPTVVHSTLMIQKKSGDLGNLAELGAQLGRGVQHRGVFGHQRPSGWCPGDRSTT